MLYLHETVYTDLHWYILMYTGYTDINTYYILYTESRYDEHKETAVNLYTIWTIYVGCLVYKPL